jgi:putative membrane protein
MMIRMAVITVLMSGAALSLACSSGKGPGDFLTKAAQGGMAEVQLGRLAQEHAASSVVKQFGQHMVDDHTKANNELKTLAAQKNVTLPQEINSDQKSEAEKLSKLSGADFDKEYIQYMVKDHEEDVEEFQKQANGGTDAEVKAFAAKTVPTLQGHLQMARDAAKTVGAK